MALDTEQITDDIRPVESTRDELTAAFDKVLPDAAAPATPAAATPSAAPSQGTDTQGSKGGSEQTPGKGVDRGDGRDVFGNFAPKNADGTPKQATPTPEPGAAPAGATPAAPVAPTPGNDAPASWKAEYKAHWDKVPAELKPYVLQREQELTRGFQEIAGARGAAQTVLNEFAPYAEQLQRENVSPAQAIRTLLQTAHGLRTGGNEFKKAIILSLAEQYGVDLGSGYNAQLAAAEAQAAHLATERMYGQASQSQAQQQAAVQQFHAFANDPKNEFFPKVRNVMGQLLSAGVAPDMQTAYEQACWQVPEVRAVMLQRQAAAPPDAQAQRRAAAAGMSVTGAPGAGGAMAPAVSGAAQGGDLRATLESAFANL